MDLVTYVLSVFQYSTVGAENDRSPPAQAESASDIRLITSTCTWYLWKPAADRDLLFPAEGGVRCGGF